jgi:hypothetical protein
MQIGWSTLAFASGTVATTVVAVSVMSLNSQPVRDNAFHVCVAKDRVLRLVETDKPCPEGQQRLRLAEADTPDVEPPKDTGNKNDDRKKVEPASKVQAPFEVVDSAGRPIIRVSDTLGPELTGRGMEVYGASGPPVAFVVADSGGHGVVRTNSANGHNATGMFAYDDAAGLRVRENDVIRADIGRKGGSYAARFYSSASQSPSAALGVSADGTGLVTVGNGKAVLASMGANATNGTVQVSNSAGINVISLAEGKSGGMLQITNKGGTTMVDAGVDPADGVGVVRAGPKHGPGRMVGLPFSSAASSGQSERNAQRRGRARRVLRKSSSKSPGRDRWQDVMR